MPEIYRTSLLTDANIQLYYRLESNLTDSSGNSRNGTGTGSPTYTNGKYANGLNLVAASQQSFTTGWNPNAGTGNFAVGGWFFVDALNGGICATRDTDVAGFQAVINSSGKAVMTLLQSGGGGDTLTSDTTLSTGTMYHLVYMRGTSGIYIYINGKLDKTGADNNRNINSGRVLKFGVSRSNNEVGNLGPWFDGVMDDLFYFNRELTAAEIRFLASGGSLAMII